jgi:hypothetical protein
MLREIDLSLNREIKVNLWRVLNVVDYVSLIDMSRDHFDDLIVRHRVSRRIGRWGASRGSWARGGGLRR